jgi:hypothetical protein
MLSEELALRRKANPQSKHPYSAREPATDSQTFVILRVLRGRPIFPPFQKLSG